MVVTDGPPFQRIPSSSSISTTCAQQRMPEEPQNPPSDNATDTAASGATTFRSSSNAKRQRRKPLRRVAVRHSADEKWNKKYEQLVKYHHENGHTNVSSKLKSELSRWVARQRNRRTNGLLSTSRGFLLDKLDFQWTIKNDRGDNNAASNARKWNTMYEQLKTFYQQHGHSNVKAKSSDEHLQKLGYWVGSQRTRYKLGKLSNEQVDSLKEVEFSFDREATLWEESYALLAAYKDKNNHCNVPRHYTCPTTGKSLGHWVSNQRQFYAQDNLTEDRKQKLLELGFDFEKASDKLDRKWNEMFEKLVAYKQKHRDCMVPRTQGDAEKNRLANWVSQQRKQYKIGRISQDRIEMLEELGFVWSIMTLDRDPTLSANQEVHWMRKFEELKAFHEEHGHISLPSVIDNKANPLTTWIKTQRKSYADGRMRRQRQMLLESIPGFVWKDGKKHRSQRIWELAFAELKMYHEQHGHTYVSEEDMYLWHWTRKANFHRQMGKMSVERQKALESIGFWDPPPRGLEPRGAEDHDMNHDDNEMILRADARKTD